MPTKQTSPNAHSSLFAQGGFVSGYRVCREEEG